MKSSLYNAHFDVATHHFCGSVQSDAEFHLSSSDVISFAIAWFTRRFGQVRGWLAQKSAHTAQRGLKSSLLPIPCLDAARNKFRLDAVNAGMFYRSLLRKKLIDDFLIGELRHATWQSKLCLMQEGK